MTRAEDLLREMQSFVSVSDELIKKAKAANINESNNPEYAEILEGWTKGRYDDDPDYVIFDIEDLLI